MAAPRANEVTDAGGERSAAIELEVEQRPLSPAAVQDEAANRGRAYEQ